MKEHPFPTIVKNRFPGQKLRYRGIKKNTAQLHTLCALADLGDRQAGSTRPNRTDNAGNLSNKMR